MPFFIVFDALKYPFFKVAPIHFQFLAGTLQTDNFRCDWHLLHMYMQVQLPYFKPIYCLKMKMIEFLLFSLKDDSHQWSSFSPPPPRCRVKLSNNKKKPTTFILIAQRYLRYIPTLAHFNHESNVWNQLISRSITKYRFSRSEKGSPLIGE